MRSDHTLAVPPPAPSPTSERIEIDLSEWPWGLERRLAEHLDAAGIDYRHGDGVMFVRAEDEEDVDAAIDVQLAAWADVQHRFGASDRRLLRGCHRAAVRLQVDTWDLRAISKVDACARRLDSMGAPDDVDDTIWRAVTLAVAELGDVLAEADRPEDDVRGAARRAADALGAILPAG